MLACLCCLDTPQDICVLWLHGSGILIARFSWYRRGHILRLNELWPLAGAAVTFRVYDLNGDGFISPAELGVTLRKLAGQALSAEQLSEVATPACPEYKPCWACLHPECGPALSTEQAPEEACF